VHDVNDLVRLTLAFLLELALGQEVQALLVGGIGASLLIRDQVATVKQFLTVMKEN